jgi:DNA (cytosine-5)-methyltransferase 1
MSVPVTRLGGAEGMTVSVARSYKVKLVRGPFLRLAPHRDHCRSPEELSALVQRLRSADPDARLAADLFSGAGGMSLGLTQAGFQVVLSADHDAEAVETHAHHFGGLALDWDLSDSGKVEAVAQLLIDNSIDLLAGGPPCQPFSKAGRSGIRNRVRQGLRDPHDQRRDLWRSFIEVVRLARPAGVLMENVPDMALDREMFILRSVVEELEQLGYAVQEQVVNSRDFGIPQFRQRLLIAAVRDRGVFRFPAPVAEQVTLWNAIGDMPEVEGGWRPEGGADGWIDYDGPTTAYQRRMRAGVTRSHAQRLYDHITRPVREDDAVAFEHMDTHTRYSQLPEQVQRYRTDIFDDKYKRLDENDLSRTITAHIAKDGYWYIHPRQGRTITVREAARIQSFPDWFRFAGPPSAAFRQIGNAVPPLMAAHVGAAMRRALDGDAVEPLNTQEIARALNDWWLTRSAPSLPWLRPATRWQVLMAELLLDRLPADQVRAIWPAVATFAQPEDVLNREADFVEITSWIDRADRAERIVETARACQQNSEVLSTGICEQAAIPGVGEAITDLAVLAAPGVEDAEEPVLVTKGVLRVARAYYGDAQLLDRQNKLTDGRLAVARLIGGAETARGAHLALLDIAASCCVSAVPDCASCPLRGSCSTAAESAAALG